MRRPLASDSEIDTALTRLSGWRRDRDWLRCAYRFDTFQRAVDFTARIAPVADELDHHPECTVRYRIVEIATSTHDSNGLTALDLQLAERIAELAATGGGAAIGGEHQPGDHGLWVPPGHFYSPITDPTETAPGATARAGIFTSKDFSPPVVANARRARRRSRGGPPGS